MSDPTLNEFLYPDPETGELSLTRAEWDALFAAPPDLPDEPLPRRWVVVAFLVIAGLLATVVIGLWSVVFNPETFTDPAEIRSRAQIAANDSDWGWLHTGVVVEIIVNPGVAAYVRNPPDGVIHLDQRGWTSEQITETTVHELGHLLAYALYPGSNAPGGLEPEVWAECAAVQQGVRSTDDADATATYRCTPAELDMFVDAVDSFDEVCRTWGAGRECRPLFR